MRTGELLKLCREMKGLSQRETAAACGVSYAFISQIETGKNNLGFETAIKLCDFYGITVERLANTVRKK